MSTYTVLRPSRSVFVPIRLYRYHVRLWGKPGPRPPLVLVHGWMDVAASYQFMVDALSHGFFDDRLIIAPDWRGFGRTRPPQPTDHYVFADYLADLDRLIDHFSGDQPVDLVGHSMGGNVLMHYAGVRPKRIRRAVNLEGFGMPAFKPEQAPERYGKWIDEIKKLHRGEMALATYAGPEGVARRLMKTNPRLGQDKADWLAAHWSVARPGPDGGERWEILGDAAHKVINANLFRVDEMLALYAAIEAPLLMVEASDDSLAGWWKRRFTRDEFHERLQSVRDVRIELVADAGHMLHHDQPQRVAALIEDFTGA